MADILVKPRDGWDRLILNRPAKLNAVNADMLRCLLAAIDAAEADPFCRIVILTGAGRGFCAGQLAMLGEAIDAATAEHWGMIWKAVDDVTLTAESEDIAVRLANSPSAALVAIRAMFAAAPHNTLHQQLDLEAMLQGEAGRSADFAEGVRAFQEKRPPRFQ